MNRRGLEEYFRDFLADKTEKQVGMINPPNAKPQIPYYIVFPMPSGQITGSWLDPQEDQEFYFQITSVGISHEQVADAGDLACKCVAGRDAQGDFFEDFDPPGYHVQQRETHQRGAVMKTGSNLFQSADVYRITVGA